MPNLAPSKSTLLIIAILLTMWANRGQLKSFENTKRMIQKAARGNLYGAMTAEAEEAAANKGPVKIYGDFSGKKK